MTFSDDPLKPEDTGSSEPPKPEEASYPEETILPEGFVPLVENAHVQRSRRRRAHRTFVLPGEAERSAFFDHLARRAVPSFEFFLFSLLCGAVLGAGYLLDIKANSQAILLLGVLLVPLLTPWVGMALAATIGSWRFFFLALGAMIVACGLAFLSSGLAGFAARLWLPLPFFSQVDIRTHIWWLDLFITALGAALLVVAFVRSEQKPVLPSIMLAYGLFMPITAAGFGWGLGQQVLWQNGLQVFLLHFAVATIVGALVLASLRFKPVKASGYILPVLTGLVSLSAVFTFTGAITAIRDGILGTRAVVLPTPTLVVLPSATATQALTFTSTRTFTSTATTEPTLTFQPTPAYAVIRSSSGGGANVRTEPGGGNLIVTLINGSIVEVLPEIQNVGNSTWVKVRLPNNLQGWVLQSVLSATTLVPPVENTITPTP
jgi:hypothetical protein